MNNKPNLTEEYKQDIAVILTNVSEGLAEKVEQNLNITINKLTDEVKKADSINLLVKEIELFNKNNTNHYLEILNQIKDNQMFENLNNSILNISNEIHKLNNLERIKSLESKLTIQKYLMCVIAFLLLILLTKTLFK